MSTAQDSTVVIGYPAGAYQVDTGYPYPPSPAPSSPARSNYDQPARSDRYLQRTKSANRTVAISLGVTLGAFIIGMALLALKGKDPEFKLESATVSRLNATGSDLTATCNITLLVTNPDHRYRVSLKTLQAWLLYRGHSRPMLQAATPLPPLVVNKRNQTRLDMKLAAVSQWVGGDVGKEIYYNSSRGFMSFRLRVRACSGRDIHNFFTGWCFLFDCDRVYFGFYHNETGTLIEPRKCDLLIPQVKKTTRSLPYFF